MGYSEGKGVTAKQCWTTILFHYMGGRVKNFGLFFDVRTLRKIMYLIPFIQRLDNVETIEFFKKFAFLFLMKRNFAAREVDRLFRQKAPKGRKFNSAFRSFKKFKVGRR